MNPYAVRWSLGRAWGYAVASFGLWTFYWFHFNRRLIDGEVGRGRDDADLHTIGLFVPILNFFVLFWLWRDISELRARVGLEPFPAAAYVFGAIFVYPLFYSLVLVRLNEYWDRRTDGLVTDHPTATAEKVLIVVGACLWATWLVITAMAIVLVVVASGS